MKTAMKMRLTLALLFWLCCGAIRAQETPSAADQWLAHPLQPPVILQPAINWTFAHPAPPASLLPGLWQTGYDWLHASSGDTFSVRMMGSGTLYGYKGGVSAIRAGIADAGTCYTLAEAKGFELTKTFQLPFVASQNPYVTARVMSELAATRLKAEFLQRGVYPGQLIPSHPLNLMSKVPIRTPADLRGKRVVSFLTAPGAGKRLGYAEVSLPFTDLASALQLGVVDVVIWADAGFVPFKIYEQAKYHTELALAPVAIETCIHRDSFDRLPPNAKRIVHDFQQQLSMAMVERLERTAPQIAAVYAANQVSMIKPNAAELELWQQAFAPVVEDALQACAAVGKDCRGLLAEIKQLSVKYEAMSDKQLIELAIRHPVPGIIDF